jgi:hypothetical protein
MVQKKDPEAKDNKPAPPVPAFYTGRYVRKLDDRLVLGDAFQIRIGYGEGGAPQSFSFRDPVATEGGAVKAPTKEHVLDSLARWAKSRTRPRNLLYPFHPDGLRVRDIKPIKAFDSYVVTQEKFRENPQMDGTYLMPSVTVLAQVTLVPSTKKLRQPPPPEPIILHFHFPCRPEAGLCWPDGKQDMQSAPPSPGIHQVPPVRAPAAPNPGKPELPPTGATPEKKAAPAPAAPAPVTKPAPTPAPAPQKQAAPAPK